MTAIRAAQLGMKTAIVEKDQIGGRCLNYACIPAKAVLRVADVLAEIREAEDFGITVSEPTVDFAAVMARRDKVVGTLTGGVAGTDEEEQGGCGRGRRLARRRRPGAVGEGDA